MLHHICTVANLRLSLWLILFLHHERPRMRTERINDYCLVSLFIIPALSCFHCHIHFNNRTYNLQMLQYIYYNFMHDELRNCDVLYEKHQTDKAQYKYILIVSNYCHTSIVQSYGVDRYIYIYICLEPVNLCVKNT